VTVFKRKEYGLSWAGYSLPLGKRTSIMGIVNVTPDSFSDGGRFLQRDKAVEQGIALAKEGADIIDVGGESTRPYSKGVSLDEEIERVIPVIEGLKRELKIPISVDTCKAPVARAAIAAGASMINDISAMRFDPDMASVAAVAGVPVILMHMKGTPGNMQDNPSYHDLIPEIMAFLKDASDRAVAAGIKREMIIIDPGIGFGKTKAHNLSIIKELDRLSVLDMPVLLATSRKGFIGLILDKEPDKRDLGTMAAISAGIMNGAHMVRVHNVRMAVETARVLDAIVD
jgi:dihydropteroate synthase